MFKVFEHLKYKKRIGTARFELATPCTPCKCATRLRYAPTKKYAYNKQSLASIAVYDEKKTVFIKILSSLKYRQGASPALSPLISDA
jgi:hypothetical protein